MFDVHLVAVFAQLSPLDFLIVLAYLIAVLGIGWYQSRKGGSSEDFPGISTK